MTAAKPNPPAAPARSIVKPKAMSSKLLTMKFMQRSAASSTSRTDTLAVREALVQESAKRDAALQARERSNPSTSVDAETRWELSYVKKIDGTGRAAVVDWGYGEVVGGDRSLAAESGSESESESESEPEQEQQQQQQQGVKSGRMVFGKFRSKAEPVKTVDKDADSDSDAADTPRVKNVSLRGLKSISNSGGPGPDKMCRGCQQPGHTQARCPQATCYACDGKGHMSMDCPRRKTTKRQPMGFDPREDPKRRRSRDY